jgi:NAD(P)H-flavin reductase
MVLEKQEKLQANNPDPMVPDRYRVVRVFKETDDTYTLALEPEIGSPSYRFKPGQFNMLYSFGMGEVPVSVSGDPSREAYVLHTIRSVGLVTASLCRLKKGAVVGLRGPFGTHWPIEDAKGKDVVVVTGGIGLAPLRPALYTMFSNRSNYGKIILLYGARTPEDILYGQELRRWGRPSGGEIHVTVDRARGDWKGNVGVVPGLISRVQYDAKNTIAMVCGPEVMMRYTLEALQDSNIASDNIYISMERNMKCAVGFCGHCQYGPTFICKDGPVFLYSRVANIFGRQEV